MTQNETIKPCPSYPNYSVSDKGRVFSKSGWRGMEIKQMTQEINGHGYPSVRIVCGEKRKRITVHRLIADAHLPPRPTPAHELRHLNGDKTRNYVSNLVWGTRKENAADREKHGKTSRGISHSIAIKKGLEGRHA